MESSEKGVQRTELRRKITCDTSGEYILIFVISIVMEFWGCKEPVNRMDSMSSFPEKAVSQRGTGRVQVQRAVS